MQISMNTWDEVSNLFDAVLDRSPAERAAFVDEIESKEPRLGALLRTLLAANDASEGVELLQLPQIDVPAERTGTLAPGTHVGPYLLRRELGHGGMAEVWLAERADGAFAREVALKLPRLSRLRADLATRFAQERDILARLEHPQIARFYDAGVSSDGTPYLAMEFVNGLPINRWCETRELDVRSRLRLFSHVLEAVQFAHAKLVIHRDLKPTNILVTPDGQVRLLDFGIAKLLADGESADATHLTQFVGRTFTPNYASPEQIRGDPLTVATDVYSLGVVLFELLTGQLPHKLGAWSSAAQLEQAIVSVDPPRPSSMISKANAQAFGSTKKRLTHQLRGDLDTIVLTALRRDPERRYRSVEAMRGDVERYLAREPIRARPDTLAYRATRFVQRHVSGVVASVLIALSIVAGVTGIIWQARLAAEQAQRAEAATNFMAGVFKLSDPSESHGETLRAREILDIAARRIDAELASSPALQADMLTLIGRIYVQLGMYANARPLLERGLALRERLHAREHVDVADGLDAIGVLQMREGKYVEAEKAFRRALATFGGTTGVESAEYATALHHVAEAITQQTRYSEAEETARAALSIRKGRFGQTHPSVADSLMLLAEIRRMRGDLNDAATFNRQALEIRRANFGDRHPDVIQSLSSLALVHYDRADYPVAEKLYAQSLAAARQTFGADHPDTLQAMNDLATVLTQEGQLARSEPLLREALNGRRHRLGTAHPTLVITLNSLASTVIRLGRHEEAVQLYREAMTIAERTLGPNHLEVAKNLNDLGVLLQQVGQLEEAELLIRRSLPILSANMGEEHSYYARALANLARVQFERGELSDAEAGARRALAIFRRSLPSGHNLTARVLLDLGRIAAAQGRFDQAEPLLREASSDLTKLFGADDPRTMEARQAFEAVATHGPRAAMKSRDLATPRE